MEFFGSFLFLIGILGILAGLIITIISAIKKRKVRKPLLASGGAFVIFIIGSITVANNTDNDDVADESDNDDVAEEVSAEDTDNNEKENANDESDDNDSKENDNSNDEDEKKNADNQSNNNDKNEEKNNSSKKYKDDNKKEESKWDDVKDEDAIIGKSDKDYSEISTQEPSKVRNDHTGNWRISKISENVDNIEEYASSYNDLHMKEDEVHFIINFNYNTTTWINEMGGILKVQVREYVEGEEHDANKLGSGMVLKDYTIYPDGDIEEVDVE